MAIKHLESIGAREGAARAGCYIDGHNTDIVDMDVLIEGEGRLVLCRRCVEAAAETLGMVSAKQAGKLKKENAGLVIDKKALLDKLRDTEKLIDELIVYRDKYIDEVERP